MRVWQEVYGDGSTWKANKEFDPLASQAATATAAAGAPSNEAKATTSSQQAAAASTGEA